MKQTKKTKKNTLEMQGDKTPIIKIKVKKTKTKKNKKGNNNEE